MRKRLWLAILLVLAATCLVIASVIIGGIQEEESESQRTVQEVSKGQGLEKVSENITLREDAFEDVSAEKNFSYRIEGEHDTEGVPAGVYVSDYDKDRREDILVVSEDGVTLFGNTGTGFRETDAVPYINTSFVSAHFFDHDNDGWEDLYLMSNEGSVFLENDKGEFVREKNGLEVTYDNVRGAATADYTGNGCADVFVVQSEDWQKSRPKSFLNTSVGIDKQNGNRNRLFKNKCGRFEEVTTEAGIQGKAWSLATSFVDFTNDGLPDIHVANDFNRDVVYINRGDGKFNRRILPEYTNRNGMSSEVIDVNNDGLLDIFVANIYERSESFDYGVEESDENTETYRFGDRTKGNNLLLNKGGGEFVDVADDYGVRYTPGWGWSAISADFQNDGLLDLFHAVDSEGEETTQSLWIGEGSGFRNSGFVRSGFGSAAARSSSELDFNSDGGVDIALGALNGPYRLYSNELERGGFLQVIVEGGQ